MERGGMWQNVAVARMEGVLIEDIGVSSRLASTASHSNVTIITFEYSTCEDKQMVCREA